MKKLLILFIGLTFFSCKPKFDPNAEWKAIDVVYTVLDPDAAEQYVLVNRAFQNKEADANDLAKMNDSIYHTDSISVRIDNLDDDADPVYLTRATKIREEGIFANPEHIVYVIDSTEFKIEDNTNYKIEVINTKTGKISYSKIKTLGEIEIQKPSSEPTNLFFVNKGKFKETDVEIYNETDKLLIYNSTLNIVYHTFALNDDLISIDTLIFTIKSSLQHDGTTGGSSDVNEERFKINGESVLSYIRDNVPENNPDESYRAFFEGFLDVTGYGEDMLNYTIAEDNFSSLSQTKPFYTNVLDASTGDEQAGLCTVKKSVRRKTILSPSTIAYIRIEFPNLGF